QVALVDAHTRDDHVAEWLLGIEDRRTAAVPLQRAAVADLPARLRIEWRRREDDLRFLSVVQNLVLLAGDDDGLHRGGNAGIPVVADKLHGAGLLADPGERRGIGRRLELRRRL